MSKPDPLLDYPLGERRPELVTTPAGTPLAEVTLDGLRSGPIEVVATLADGQIERVELDP